MINAQEHKNITAWLEEIKAKGTWPDHDLHIDRINSGIKQEREKWVSKSLEYLVFANDQIKGSDFRIILTISLETTQSPRNADNIVLDSIRLSDLHQRTPPSLYLYNKDHDTFKLIASKIADAAKKSHEFNYFLGEFQDEDGYNGSVHVLVTE